MKRIVLSCVLFLIVSACHAQAYCDAAIGNWLSENQRCKVNIYKSGDKYYGKITWLYEQIDPETGKAKLDKENPDPAKQNRPLIGLVVLKNFNYQDGYWQNGTVYNSMNGSTYDCSFWLENKTKLVLRGYWGLFYHTETWTRIQ